MTMAAYSDQWFKRTAERCDWKHATRLSYSAHLDRIKAELGDVYVDKLNVPKAQAFIDGEAKRYARVVTRTRLGVLRRILRSTCGDFDLPKDIGSLLERPPKPKERGTKGLNAVSGPQLRTLWDVMEVTEVEWFPLFALIASTGLRFSEASAVQWGDFTEQDGLVRLEMQRAQYQRVLGEPKTVASARALPILPHLWDVLKKHRAELLKAQNPGLAKGWVFPTSVGTLLTSGSLNKPLRRGLNAAGLDVHLTTHGLSAKRKHVGTPGRSRRNGQKDSWPLH